MRILENGESVISPFLEQKAVEENSLHELAESLESELESVMRGETRFNYVNESIMDYEFNAETNTWDEPVKASVLPTDNYPYVRETAEEVWNLFNNADDYAVTLLDDFGIPPAQRKQQASQYPFQIQIGDKEDQAINTSENGIEGNITLIGPNGKDFIDIDRAQEVIDSYEIDNATRDSGSENIYQTHINGSDVSVVPDLAAGVFQVETEFGAFSQESKIWTPYIGREDTILVDPPTPENNTVQAEVVPTSAEAYTNNFALDAMAEAADYYAPFSGILQPEVSSEAVDYFTSNNLSQQPYGINVKQEAMEKLSERDNAHRIRDEIYHIASHQGTKPLDRNHRGNIQQVDSDDNYIIWETNSIEAGEQIVLKDILDRDEVFPGKDRN